MKGHLPQRLFAVLVAAFLVATTVSVLAQDHEDARKASQTEWLTYVDPLFN